MAQQLKFHALAELLPMMPDGELAELAADIKANGQHEQIVLLDGEILDGRGRYLACLDAKIKPDVRKYNRMVDGNDPVSFVLTANVFRRHLTASQRAIALAELRKRQVGYGTATTLGKVVQNGGRAPIGARPNDSEQVNIPVVPLDSLAAASSVSSRTMDRANKVVHRAAPAIVAAVRSGDVALSDAAAIADLPKPEQKAALKVVESGKAKTLKAAVDKPRPSGKQKSDPRVWARWEELFGKLKRETDAVNKLMPGEKFCRQAQSKLNEALEVTKEWRRATR